MTAAGQTVDLPESGHHRAQPVLPAVQTGIFGKGVVGLEEIFTGEENLHSASRACVAMRPEMLPQKPPADSDP